MNVNPGSTSPSVLRGHAETMPLTTTTTITHPDATVIHVATTTPPATAPAPAFPHVVYCAAHCYGAPIPDERVPGLDLSCFPTR